MKTPYLTVDAIIETEKGIVLIKRKNPPYGLALPGGFVDIGKTVEQTVQYKVKNETCLNFIDFKQFRVYSDPKRDIRFHTASVVFIGKGTGKINSTIHSKEAIIIKYDQLKEIDCCFDHNKIISDYLKYKGKK